jgi:hypothetical protein
MKPWLITIWDILLYAYYPVVGVKNWIQAVEFSKWRTDRCNEAILEKKVIWRKMQNRWCFCRKFFFSTDTCQLRQLTWR